MSNCNTIPFLFLFGFLLLGLSSAAQPDAKVQNGLLFLKMEDLEERVIALDGEWEVYWDTLLHPDEFSMLDAPLPTMVPFPIPWNNLQSDYPEFQSKGYATYRMRIQLDTTSELLALSIPDFYSSYKIRYS